jgi:hypothetical protein
MIGWTDQTQQPPHGPLFQACLGGSAELWGGATVAAAQNSTQIVFTTPHGLTPGQAVVYLGEMRFVTGIPNNTTVQINAPFTTTPKANTRMTPTAGYTLATELPSVSIFDYWSPTTAAQRLIAGAAVNELQVKVNNDYHEFVFSGGAADLLDSSSFQTGQGNLTQFPAEPAVNPLSYSIIPGHLGQAWLGSTPSQFVTLTKATVGISNGLALRDKEFGSNLARGISPGSRNVSLDFSLYQLDDAGTQALYQAARQRSPISVMLQLGEQSGQLFGIYMSAVIPEVPAYDDSDKRLQWGLQKCRAQGTLNDEVFIAFG